jgi:hypothetical protein
MKLFNIIRPAALLVAGLVMLTGTPRAQTSATVTVTAGTPLATLPPAAVGLNTAVWDGNLLDAAVPGLLSAAGITALRYPGGSTSDVYDWQTNAIVPGQGSFANPNNGFIAFASLAQKVGAMPVITINYGSGPTGSGGGSTALAAAWVQQANITQGLGIKYWEIGNEIYGNGEYGAQWETDLHSAHDPTTYGANVVQFATAMKAVDPTIKVGAVLTAPGNWPDGQSPDWNSHVLAQCGSTIDFVIVHWYAQQPGSVSDSVLLGSPQNGNSTTPGIGAMMTKLKALIAQFGGANAAKIQILVTETNSVAYNPGKQTVSLVNGLFAADTILTWLENGAASVDVWDLHNGSSFNNNSSSLFGTANYGDYGILSNGSANEPAADTPQPTYFGMQMLTTLGKPGDALVAASSSNPLLSAHAVQQANGNLALLLINKDPANTTTTSVALSGFTPAASGTVFSYGKTSTAITSATVTGLGASFSVPTPPYSLTTILLTPSGGTVAPSPGFTLAAIPATLSVAQGGSGTASITLTPAGGFGGSVTYAASGVPDGVTATFSPVAGSGPATLTLAVGASAAIGTSVMTVTGTSGALNATTTVALSVTGSVVTPPPTPGFTLAANPGAVTVAQGASASVALTVAPTGGFAGSVAFAAAGLPNGVSASFTPATATTGGTLTLTATATATPGSSSITITGTSGTLSQSATIALTVAAPASGGGPVALTTHLDNDPWYNDEEIDLATTAPITAFTLTITIPSTNVTFSGMWNNVSGAIQQSHASGASIVYIFTLAAGGTISPGNFYIFAAQTGGDGTQHDPSGDTWTATYTAGGQTFTQSGTL